MNRSLKERLETGLSARTASSRAIANYMLANLQALPFETSAAIAEKLGISESTVGRFCRALGYPHFKALKADLKDAAEVVQTAAKLVARAAKHSKHPKIYIAAKGTALVASIMKAVNPALNIWGVFYVEDRRCPDFG